MLDAALILGIKENLVARFRGVEQPPLVFEVVAAVFATSAAVARCGGRLESQCQGCFHTVCLYKAPVYEYVAPMGPLLSPVIETQCIHVACILCSVVLARVGRLIVQLVVIFLLKVSILDQRNINHFLTII